MPTLLHSVLTAVLALSVVGLAGCALSASSESSSKSAQSSSTIASSPFASSVRSSATEQENFASDIADYTAEFVVASSGSIAGFRNQLGKIAQDHGISNWESSHATYLAIGRGLKKAGLGAPQNAAFTETLSGGDAMKRQAILEGFNQ